MEKNAKREALEAEYISLFKDVHGQAPMFLSGVTPYYELSDEELNRRIEKLMEKIIDRA